MNADEGTRDRATVPWGAFWFVWCAGPGTVLLAFLVCDGSMTSRAYAKLQVMAMVLAVFGQWFAGGVTLMLAVLLERHDRRRPELLLLALYWAAILGLVVTVVGGGGVSWLRSRRG